MKRCWTAVIAASALLAAVSHSARAEDAKEAGKPNNEFANKLYAADVTKQKKTYVCFVREYDGAHLVKHPRQKVSAMKLLVTAEQVPEDENINHSFSLGLNSAIARRTSTSGGSCGHAKASRR